MDREAWQATVHGVTEESDMTKATDTHSQLLKHQENLPSPNNSASKGKTEPHHRKRSQKGLHRVSHSTAETENMT